MKNERSKKLNLHELDSLHSILSKRYPFSFTTDIGFPTSKNPNNNIFLDIDEINRNGKIINMTKQQSDSAETNSCMDISRCRGGIDMVTLTYDRKLKICNSALDSEFYWHNEVSAENFYDLWLNPTNNIKEMRSERITDIENCKTYSKLSNCLPVNCRVLARIYTGSHYNHNPLSC